MSSPWQTRVYCCYLISDSFSFLLKSILATLDSLFSWSTKQHWGCEFALSSWNYSLLSLFLLFLLFFIFPVHLLRAGILNYLCKAACLVILNSLSRPHFYFQLLSASDAVSMAASLFPTTIETTWAHVSSVCSPLSPQGLENAWYKKGTPWLFIGCILVSLSLKKKHKPPYWISKDDKQHIKTECQNPPAHCSIIWLDFILCW